MAQYFWKPEEHTRGLGFGDHHIFVGKDTRRFRASLVMVVAVPRLWKEENLGQSSGKSIRTPSA